MSHRKYFFTPETDQQITRVYQGMTGKGQVTALAKRIGIPKQIIYKHAIEASLVQPRTKEPTWSDNELKILKLNAHKSVQKIQIQLKQFGFNRSINGISLKRKRLRMPANLEGHTGTGLALCFGVDFSVVKRWIKLGYLKAKRRGTARTEKQGGDMWWIKEKDIKTFIIENIIIIDIRKVDKFWFVDMLTVPSQ